ncbi:S16 family serine protease [Candidatus Nitrospira bockiana]
MKAVRITAWPFLWVIALLAVLAVGVRPASASILREQLIPILGVTIEEKQVVGAVASVRISFEERRDRSGLAVQFQRGPGKFSHMAQTAVEQAIYRTARAAGLGTESWTIVLSVLDPGVTLYGESLSAMVGLSVVALAKGDLVLPDRTITGTVTPDGHIGPVGAVPLKVMAAEQAHIRRILVPEEHDPADGDWRTPFLLQISPVGSVNQAYFALTDHPLR